MFDPAVGQVGVDRNNNGFLVPLAHVIDEMTERDAEEVSDMQPDERLVTGRRDEVVEVFEQKASVDSGMLPPVISARGRPLAAWNSTAAL